MSAALAEATTRSLVVEGDSSPVLDAVSQPDCALAIWTRLADAIVTSVLGQLPHGQIDDIDEEIPLDGLALRLAISLGAAGYPADVALLLVRDISLLAERHIIRMGCSACRLRLEWIETDGCRKFHADVVTARLLTTYFGRGTQWRHAHEPDGAASELPAGSVAVFKGRLLAPDAPILHRSPPITGTGERRLLLAVDALTAIGDVERV
jgi:hypothetical protein